MNIVCKIGGSILEPDPSPTLLASLAARVRDGERLIVVHGGGKTLNALLDSLGVRSQFRQGLRVTDAATLRAAIMVFAGTVNKRLVGELNARGVRAVGLTGLDGDCVRARCVDPEMGYVGEIERVDPSLLLTLLDAGFVPVLAPLASCCEGGALNVNADHFAAACAAAVGAARVIFLTDVEGVLDAGRHTIPGIAVDELEAMVASGAVSGGMLPKLAACRAALEGGVPTVEILGLSGAGTRVYSAGGAGA